MEFFVETNQTKNNKTSKKKQKFAYSFLTILLLGALALMIRSAADNIFKSIVNAEKIKEMKVLKVNAQKKGIKLHQEIDEMGSLKSLEEIARNNLKMAGKDEVLVLVNPKEEQEKEKEKDKKKPSDKH